VELEHGDVEASEVEDLEHPRIGQQALEIRGVVRRPVQAHHVGVPLAGAQLHHAQRVAPQAQAHGLRIDGDRRRLREQSVRKIALMKMVGQGVSEGAAGAP
jgi:hypothetical protein